MKLSTALSALLCAGVVVASPVAELRRAARAKRAAQRHSNPPNPVSGTSNAIEAANTNETAHVQYSSNWAGAVLIGSGYTSVTGTIVVPTPKMPSGGSSRTEYAASAWVGIDGDTCSSAILQTGVDFYVQGTQVSFDAWYEWYPDYAYNFNNIDIKAGDTITMTVTASSKSGGNATITNKNTGQSVYKIFSGETNQLCQTNAEWIVEDFSSGTSLVPFADFQTVTFTGASAKTGSGTVDVSGATILDIRQNNKVLTQCGTSGSSSVTCTYTGSSGSGSGTGSSPSPSSSTRPSSTAPLSSTSTQAIGPPTARPSGRPTGRPGWF